MFYRVVTFETAGKKLWRVFLLPGPRCAHRDGVMPPAKHALVGTRERGRRFHAAMAGDAIKGVLVAATAAA